MPKLPVRLLMIASVLLVISGCEKQSAPAFSSPPTIHANTNSGTPLVAVLSARTTVPALLNIDISDGERSWSVPANATPATEHEVLLMGFRADRQHAVIASVTGPDGAVADAATPGICYAGTAGVFPGSGGQRQ